MSVHSVCLQEESSTAPPSRSTPVSSGSGLQKPPGTRVKNETEGMQMTGTGPAKGVKRKRKKMQSDQDSNAPNSALPQNRSTYIKGCLSEEACPQPLHGGFIPLASRWRTLDRRAPPLSQLSFPPTNTSRHHLFVYSWKTLETAGSIFHREKTEAGHRTLGPRVTAWYEFVASVLIPPSLLVSTEQ